MVIRYIKTNVMVYMFLARKVAFSHKNRKERLLSDNFMVNRRTHSVSLIINLNYINLVIDHS